MLIDDITITIASGKGGPGKVAFNKNMMSLGPAGGSGGKGGDVYAEGVLDIGALSRFRFKKDWKAENGEEGRGQFRDGHNGSDLILKLPVGTVIHNLTTGKDEEIQAAGERILIAKGGYGGKGNFHFRSPRNTSPKQFQKGLPGEQARLRLELKLIADIGLVGLPNVGKSSFLNRVTNAKAKVANYHFTTLEPNLGVYYGTILADIPGLIEHSSEGKGLGIKFLRHIERTRILFHFVSAESPDPEEDYKTIRKELGAYNKALLKKPEYLFLTKSDVLDEASLRQKLSKLKKLNPNASGLCIYDDGSIKNAQKILGAVRNAKTVTAKTSL